MFTIQTADGDLTGFTSYEAARAHQRAAGLIGSTVVPAGMTAVWTPEDYAETVRAARAHRANPSNVIAL
ncbi:hypothetical protein SEA_CAMBIARE_58 [Mycobacterium phage Cambiare]|uniref:Uncharacterized protein n=1 Tax=Mycobacterium phage Cambiare TaxID=1647305 RepID=A0A0F6WE53_9CAUD|nr:hypothetical protein AVT48_gp58 [Mycobacterium phage Cambiare]AKF14560.1 hypothetical protein SEA_CAMBIARE_58 [Mycobacterium phage Cambiare]